MLMVSINSNSGPVFPPQYQQFRNPGADGDATAPGAGANVSPPASSPRVEPVTQTKPSRPALSDAPGTRNQIAGLAALGMSFAKLIVSLGHRLKLRSLLPPPEPKPADRKEPPKAIDEQEFPAPTVAAMAPPIAEAAKPGQRRDDARRPRPQDPAAKIGK